MLRLAGVGRHQISCATNPLIRCGCPTGPEAEERLKGCRRRLPTIVPERELVEIHLELRSTDTMMRADQPLLKIADCPVRQRNDRSSSLPKFLTQRLRARDMLEAGDRQAVELFQPVGVDRRARPHVLLDKGRQRGRLEVWDHRLSVANCQSCGEDASTNA